MIISVVGELERRECGNRADRASGIAVVRRIAKEVRRSYAIESLHVDGRDIRATVPSRGHSRVVVAEVDIVSTTGRVADRPLQLTAAVGAVCVADVDLVVETVAHLLQTPDIVFLHESVYFARSEFHLACRRVDE